MRLALRIIALAALCSASLWAFAGIPLWASVDDNYGRGIFVFIFHLVAIAGGIFSYAP